MPKVFAAFSTQTSLFCITRYARNLCLNLHAARAFQASAVLYITVSNHALTLVFHSGVLPTNANLEASNL